MPWKELLKPYKPFHWLYNLLHLKALRHNRMAYRQYQLRKPLFASISSKDFPDKHSQAWLDVEHSAEVVATQPSFASFDSHIQDQLKNWSDKGFLILPQFFSPAAIDAVNDAVSEIIQKGIVKPATDTRMLHCHKHHPAIKNMMLDARLKNLLSFILDKEVVPFQTLNFIKGSQQRAHSDSIHMTTYPLGYLIAAWIALEDIHEGSGPLFYYPGSHRLPFLLNDDFQNYSSRLRLGKKDYADYEDMIEEILQRHPFQKEVFLARKGDVLIWHANLIHGGMPVTNPALTRKSMVIHYFAKNVIKYHEITERPSLMEEA